MARKDGELLTICVPSRPSLLHPSTYLLRLAFNHKIVAFVYFAIAGATTHKFTKYHVAGDAERLCSGDIHESHSIRISQRS